MFGAETTGILRETSLRLYSEAREYARQRGIIIADTKFEFGRDKDGQIILIDEVLTPDSSRFWPLEANMPGTFTAFVRQTVRPRLPRNTELGQKATSSRNSR